MSVVGRGARGAEEVDRCNYKRQFAGKGEKVDSVSGRPFCSMNRERFVTFGTKICRNSR